MLIHLYPFSFFFPLFNRNFCSSYFFLCIVRAMRRYNIMKIFVIQSQSLMLFPYCRKKVCGFLPVYNIRSPVLLLQEILFYFSIIFSSVCRMWKLNHHCWTLFAFNWTAWALNFLKIRITKLVNAIQKLERWNSQVRQQHLSSGGTIRTSPQIKFTAVQVWFQNAFFLLFNLIMFQINFRMTNIWSLRCISHSLSVCRLKSWKKLTGMLKVEIKRERVKTD